MIAARRREREYFSSSADYGHLAHKMGSEYLAKLLSQVGLSKFPVGVYYQIFSHHEKFFFSIWNL